MTFGGSQLLLIEEGVGRFSTVLHHGDGTEMRLPVTTPAKDLIAATEIDYRKYRGEIKRLRDEHPLFEDRLDISVMDFEDFVAEALLLPAVLEKIDPVSFLRWVSFCTRACRRKTTAVLHFCWMPQGNCFTYWRSRSAHKFVCRIFSR